jgi:hypothetical protein
MIKLKTQGEQEDREKREDYYNDIIINNWIIYKKKKSVTPSPSD